MFETVLSVEDCDDKVMINEEAVDLVVQMAEETYRETGNGDILRYLKSRCSERQGRLM